MNRIVLMILCISLVFCGCSANNDLENPCNFYYLQREINNTGEDSVIAVQITEASGFSVQELISQYLSGVPDAKLVSPFPAGMDLISFEQEDRYIRVTVSDELASLSGIDLTLACVCIGKTCFELTQAEQFEIQCQTQKLNGSDSIILSRDTFTLQDTFLPDLPDTTNP